jgi:hypothetical protein
VHQLRVTRLRAWEGLCVGCGVDDIQYVALQAGAVFQALIVDDENRWQRACKTFFGEVTGKGSWGKSGVAHEKESMQPGTLRSIHELWWLVLER